MKTAGTSVTSMLDETLEWDDIILGGTKLGECVQEPYREKYSMHKHSKAREIIKVIGRDRWDDYFTFAFVRNPYSRAVSLYTYIEKIVNNSGYKKRLRFFRKKYTPQALTWPASKAYMESSSFSDFIRNENFLSSMGAQRQVEWLQTMNGDLIVDFIGKVENLADDINIISKKLDLKLGQIKELNISAKHKHISQFLSGEKDYEYLYDLYREDFRVLGYDPDFRF